MFLKIYNRTFLNGTGGRKDHENFSGDDDDDLQN